MNNPIKSMQGMTVIGFLLIMIIVIFMGVLGVNIIPIYMQHYEVKDILNDLAKDPALKQANKGRIKELFSRRLQVNSIGSGVIKPEDLEVEKKEGKTMMSLHYEVRTHIFGNIDVVIKFDDKIESE